MDDDERSIVQTDKELEEGDVGCSGMRRMEKDEGIYL